MHRKDAAAFSGACSAVNSSILLHSRRAHRLYQLMTFLVYVRRTLPMAALNDVTLGSNDVRFVGLTPETSRLFAISSRVISSIAVTLAARPAKI